MPHVSITPEMIKGFKTVTCQCGGVLFDMGLIIKIIPALLSPTGKETEYPMQVLICKKCGKVPEESNKMYDNVLPQEILSKNLFKDI